MFDDLLDANRRYTLDFDLGHLEPRAALGLAVVLCMDSRIEPLRMVGLEPGDAKILRNAGARVTDDVLRSLILGVSLLGVERIAVIPHTRCAMTTRDDDGMRAAVTEAQGVDASGWDFLTIPDTTATLTADLQRIRDCELIPQTVELGGFLYDVETGTLTQLV